MPDVVFNERLLDVRPDRLDLRDFPYRAPLRSLPPEYPEPERLAACFPRYAADDMVLDQGTEGACTGFGLAAVINYLRWIRLAEAAPRSRRFKPPAKVSTRMLYHLARFYDEWPGEDYSGSSCRGAMKGWHRHGVCSEALWPYRDGSGAATFVRPSDGWDTAAAECPLGVYYRVDRQAIVDMQAAVCEVGAVYVSANVHAGWFPAKWTLRGKIACIEGGAASAPRGGHAFAIVGYNRWGFIVQNSWGPKWGTHGFAVLPYEDWLAHGLDAWVAVLGALIEHAAASSYHADQSLVARAAAVSRDAPRKPTRRDRDAGLQPWSREAGYAHTVVMGHAGAVINRSVDRETFAALERALYEAPLLSARSGVSRLVIYAQSGLASEEHALERVRALGPYLEANGAHPLFLTWRTGFLESLADIVGDRLESVEPRGVWRDIWHAVRQSGEGRDRAIEATCQELLVRSMWRQMMENAEAAARVRQPVMATGPRAATTAPPTLVSVVSALQRLRQALPRLQIHLVAHSAGAMLLGHLLDVAREHGVAVDSCTLLAPACSLQFALDHVKPAIESGTLRKSSLHVELLSDERERHDSVGPYGRSLLYLASRALEAHHKTPLLGMETAWHTRRLREHWADDAGVQASVRAWQAFWRGGRPPRVTATPQVSNGVRQIPASHRSFEQDVDVMTRTIERVAGKPLAWPVASL